MKGVILAGGKGLRLYPLTKVTNKHLLPVGKEPMILNPIKKLIESGIKDILIVTSTEHMGSIVNLLGSGAEYGCCFTYKVQEGALGIANALALAENFAQKDKIMVILGDNITTVSLKPFVEKLVTRAKKADFNARKYIKGVLPTTQQGKKLFSEVIPVFLDTPGGYTRIIKLGRRAGDSAPMARLEWSKEVKVKDE